MLRTDGFYKVPDYEYLYDLDSIKIDNKKEILFYDTEDILSKFWKNIKACYE